MAPALECLQLVQLAAVALVEAPVVAWAEAVVGPAAWAHQVAYLADHLVVVDLVIVDFGLGP